MILVNNKSINWFEKMDIYNLLKTMGYTIRKPAVLIKVNDNVVKKTDWDKFIIPENSEITVVNLLRGG